MKIENIKFKAKRLDSGDLWIFAEKAQHQTGRIIMSNDNAIKKIQALKRDCIYTYISRDISKEVCRDLIFRLEEIIKELEFSGQFQQQK